MTIGVRKSQFIRLCSSKAPAFAIGGTSAMWCRSFAATALKIINLEYGWRERTITYIAMPMLKLTNDLEIFGISHRHIFIGASAPTRPRNFGILEGDMWNRFRNISCSGKRLSENHGIIMCSSQLNCIHPGSRIKCL